MAHFVYIIFSPTVDKYYIGETIDFEARLKQHNDHFFNASFTKQAADWEMFILIPCVDISHAKKLESFIKKMKSRSFIESLKTDPQKLNAIVQKTAEGHSPDASGRTL